MDGCALEVRVFGGDAFRWSKDDVTVIQDTRREPCILAARYRNGRVRAVFEHTDYERMVTDHWDSIPILFSLDERTTDELIAAATSEAQRVAYAENRETHDKYVAKIRALETAEEKEAYRRTVRSKAARHVDKVTDAFFTDPAAYGVSLDTTKISPGDWHFVANVGGSPFGIYIGKKVCVAFAMAMMVRDRYFDSRQDSLAAAKLVFDPRNRMPNVFDAPMGVLLTRFEADLLTDVRVKGKKGEPAETILMQDSSCLFIQPDPKNPVSRAIPSHGLLLTEVGPAPDWPSEFDPFLRTLMCHFKKQGAKTEAVVFYTRYSRHPTPLDADAMRAVTKSSIGLGDEGDEIMTPPEALEYLSTKTPQMYAAFSDLLSGQNLEVLESSKWVISNMGKTTLSPAVKFYLNCFPSLSASGAEAGPAGDDSDSDYEDQGEDDDMESFINDQGEEEEDDDSCVEDEDEEPGSKRPRSSSGPEPKKRKALDE